MPTFSGTVSGIFSNPQLAGYFIPVGGGAQFQDNTGTAVDSGIRTSAIQWGTFPPNTVPVFSSLSFTGASFSSVASGDIIRLGTLEYSNGTSDQPSIIFGAKLTFSVAGASITPGSTTLTIDTTLNGNVNPNDDADFIGFSQFPQTFRVNEGASASADVFGTISATGAVTVTGIGDPSGGGFIGGTAPGHHIYKYITHLDPGLNYASALSGQPKNAPYNGVAMFFDGPSGSVIGTGLGDDFNLGSGHIQVSEITGQNIFAFGSGWGQVKGGDGSNSYLFSGQLYSDAAGNHDLIYDFTGAGTPRGTAGHDYLDFVGYAPGTHLVLKGASGANLAQQTYQLLDAGNHSLGIFSLTQTDVHAGTAPVLKLGTDYFFV